MPGHRRDGRLALVLLEVGILQNLGDRAHRLDQAGTGGLRAITPPGILIENADDVRLCAVEVAWGDAPAGEYGAALDVRRSRDVSWSGFRGAAFNGGAAILVDGLAVSVG